MVRCHHMVHACTRAIRASRACILRYDMAVWHKRKHLPIGQVACSIRLHSAIWTAYAQTVRMHACIVLAITCLHAVRVPPLASCC